jgi:hypothetical protein
MLFLSFCQVRYIPNTNETQGVAEFDWSKGSHSNDQLLDLVCLYLAGRAAEEVRSLGFGYNIAAMIICHMLLSQVCFGSH